MILLVLKFHGFFQLLVLGVDLLLIEISNLMIGYAADRDHFPTGYQDSLILKVSSLVWSKKLLETIKRETEKEVKLGLSMMWFIQQQLKKRTLINFQQKVFIFTDFS